MKNIKLIEVPSEIGAGTRGASLGVEAVKIAALDFMSNFFVHFPSEKVKTENQLLFEPIHSPYAKRLSGVLTMYERISKAVEDTIKNNFFPMVLSGDHSNAGGTIAGIKAAKPNSRLGVIWIDAHADLHTPYTTPSGNIHGMPVAVLLGMGDETLTRIGGEESFLKKENIVYIGSRDLDIGERKAMKEQGIKVFTMHEIDDMVIKKVMEEAIKIAGEGTDGIHVSFDLDAVDPEIAPGTGTKVPGGMGYRETHHALEMIAMSNKLVSVEFVEVNPLLDRQNTTAEVTVALAGSLLGEWLI